MTIPLDIPITTPVRVVSSMSATGLPTWDVDWLHVEHGDCIDDLGRRWSVAKHPDGEKGWSTRPAPVTNRDARPDGDGAYRSRAWSKERLITLSGSVWCPTVELRERTEADLAGLCGDGGRLYPYRRTTETFDQVVSVELDDEPIIDVITLQRVDWSFRFAAPDPRKHHYYWQEPRASPATLGAPGAGVDYTGSGVDYTGGLAYGEGPPGDPRDAKVANFGTAVARPFFTLTGPQPAPAIQRIETGSTLEYRDDLATGETVSINCDEFTARGVPPQTAISSTRGDVTSLLTVSTVWPEIAPQDVATFRILGSGAPETLTVALRSAWK